MKFVVKGEHMGRRVEVSWRDGQIEGDDRLVEELLALDGVEEPVGTTTEGHRFASLATHEAALDTITYWVNVVTAVEGDIPEGLTEADYLD